MRYALAGLALSVVVVTAGVVTTDFLDFHASENDGRDKIFYTDSWIEEPYTKLQVELHNSIEYQDNPTGRERILMKETVINGKVWWTIIKRAPVPSSSMLGSAPPNTL